MNRQIDKQTEERERGEEGGRKQGKNCIVCMHRIETGGLAMSKNKRERKRGEEEERDGAGRGREENRPRIYLN